MIINHNMSAINANRSLKFNDWEIRQEHGKTLLRSEDQQGGR